MNWRYGIHPNNYAIGETEKYYSDMSEKGWELVKCGITLSRFQKNRTQENAIPGRGCKSEIFRGRASARRTDCSLRGLRLGVCHQPRIPAHFPCTGRK